MRLLSKDADFKKQRELFASSLDSTFVTDVVSGITREVVSGNSLTQKCTDWLKQRNYMLESPFSKEEENFPLAYVVLLHKNIGQAERLLRAIWQKQNSYCVHVDLNASEAFKSQVRALVHCLNSAGAAGGAGQAGHGQTFLVSEPVRVYYSSFTRVEAEMRCMQDLHKRNIHYQYVLNLCGQDYPLRTNLQLVRDLKSLNGRGEIFSVDVNLVEKLWRVKQVWRLKPDAVAEIKTERTKTVENDKMKARAGKLDRDSEFFFSEMKGAVVDEKAGATTSSAAGTGNSADNAYKDTSFLFHDEKAGERNAWTPLEVAGEEYDLPDLRARPRLYNWLDRSMTEEELALTYDPVQTQKKRVLIGSSGKRERWSGDWGVIRLASVYQHGKRIAGGINTESRRSARRGKEGAGKKGAEYQDSGHDGKNRCGRQVGSAPRLLLLTFSLVWVCVAAFHVVLQFYRFRSEQRPFQNLQRAARRTQLEIVALTTYDCNTRQNCPPAVLAREEGKKRIQAGGAGARVDVPAMIFRFTALDAPQARRWFARQMEVEKWDRLRTRQDLLAVIDYAFRSRLMQGGLGAAREAKVPMMNQGKPVGGTLELALQPPPPSPEPVRERPLKTVSRKMPGTGATLSMSRSRATPSASAPGACTPDVEDPWAWYENCPNPRPGNMDVGAVFESLAPADARVPIPGLLAPDRIGIAYHFEFDDLFLQRSTCAVYSFDPSMQRYFSTNERKEIDYRRGPRHAFSLTALGKADGRHDGSKHSTLYDQSIKEYDVKTLATLMKERKIETLDVFYGEPIATYNLQLIVGEKKNQGAEWEMIDRSPPRLRNG
eukprot:g12827.t1